MLASQSSKPLQPLPEVQVPPVLDPFNGDHFRAVYSAIEASTQATSNEVRRPAEATLRACEQSANFSSVLLSIVASQSASHVRVVAVILLKNLVGSCWKSRGGTCRLVSDAEKEEVRSFLLSHLEEPDKAVAVQLAVLVAKIARHDWPKCWPMLIQQLVSAAFRENGRDASSNYLCRHRALYSLHHTLKELSTKRVGLDKAAFISAAQDVFPVLRLAWNSAASSGDDPTWTTLLVKTMHRLVLYGMPDLANPEVGPWFEGLLHNMQAIVGTLSSPACHDGDTDTVVLLQKQLKRSAMAIVDAQSRHPVGFRPFLGPFLSFFYSQLTTLTAFPGTSTFETFLIQCSAFLSSTLGCSAYRADLLQSSVGRGRVITGMGDSRVSQQTASEILSVMSTFWTNERIVELCQFCLERLLQLSAVDLESWKEDPESFFLVQDSLQPSESLRVSGEHLYLSIMEAQGKSDIVGPMVAKLAVGSPQLQLEVHATCQITSEVLRWDGIYLAAGLANYHVSSFLEFGSWFTTTLGPGLKLSLSKGSTCPPVLLCRALWLIGCWADRVPREMQAELLDIISIVIGNVQDACVRLTALTALSGLLELWDLDSHSILPPILGRLVEALYSLLGGVEQFESRQQVLSAVVAVVQRSGPLISPYAAAVVRPLPSVWEASHDQTPLRANCLSIASRVVRGSASDPAALVSICPIIMPMIALATNVEGESEGFLMGGGLELWYSLLRCCPFYGPELHALFERIPHLLARDLEHLKVSMLILEAYVLLGSSEFLRGYGLAVGSCLEQLLGQTSQQGTAYVVRAFESILRKFPVEGAQLMIPALQKALDACLLCSGPGATGAARGGSPPQREPDVVLAQYISLLCRAMLGGGSQVWQEILRRSQATTEALAHVMLALFDSAAGAGVDGVWHRKLWVWALMSAMASGNQEILSEMDELVSVCVDVLCELAAMGGDGSSGGTGAPSPGGERDAQKFRLRHEGSDEEEAFCDPFAQLLHRDAHADPVMSVNLKEVIRRSMDACAAIAGPQAFQAAMETVEPAVLQQLQSMV